MAVDPFSPEHVEFTPVSPTLAIARRLQLVFWMLFPIGAAIVWLVLEPGWGPGAACAAAALLTGWGWIVIGRQVRAMGYAERDDDLLIRRGVMFRRLVVVPYGRLQHVTVDAGPLDRALHLAQIRLHTASAGTDATIPGLPEQAAAVLRDRLAARGEAQLAGL